MPFTTATAKAASDLAHGKVIDIHGNKVRGRKPAHSTQASDLMLVVYRSTIALAALNPLSPETELHARVVQALASGAKGWQSLCEQSRVIQGKGKPKPVESVNTGKARKAKPQTIGPA